ncbi:MAG: HAMP domain-containing histidine kinase [Oscillospiraceae bacterium]|nr:HAMP domain-containing histidine kinase [Oscillospiraceae bacterium]
MKSYIIRFAAFMMLFAVLAFAADRAAESITDRNVSARNVVVHRITDMIEQELSQGAEPQDAGRRAFSDRISHWRSLYGQEQCPYEVKVILFDSGYAPDTDADMSGDRMICGLYDDSRLIGVAEYRFRGNVYGEIRKLIYAVIGGCALIMLIGGVWMIHRIVKPFNRLSEYPVRLASGSMEKLPQSDSKFFGKYIWGMNMLSDKLETDRRTINRMFTERQRFITTLIHGIKTPAANIKLLSEAIATGLYSPDGKVNEKDAELAGRIESNADDIEQLVRKVLDSSANEIFDFDPETVPFYRSSLEKRIRDEYTDALNVMKIPFEIKSGSDVMINSDINGVIRIIRQLMDNAVKYGDGTGITVAMDKTDDGHFITVTNKGDPLPDSELPFVWGSLWRGSNSEGIKGNGVGLYEARLIARKLGGDLYMRTAENMTKVVLFLP